TGQRVAEGDDPVDRYAGHGGGAGVGAGGENLTAEHRETVDDRQRDADGDRRQEEGRQEGTDLQPAEGADLRRKMAVGHGLGEDQHGAEIEAGASERNDEAVDAGTDNGEAVQPAEDGAEG